MRFLCLTFALLLISGCNNPENISVNAGPNIYSDGYEPIELRGKLLSESKLKTYSYKWVISSRPDGSLSRIENEDSLTGTLEPDLPGEYEVSLKLYRFGFTVKQDTATITVADRSADSKNGEVYASSELQEKLDSLGSFTEILLNPLLTYIFDSELNLRDFHSITINGRGATIKRADSSITSVTLQESYTGGLNLLINEKNPNIKAGDTLAIAKSQSITDLELRQVTKVSANIITVSSPFTKSYEPGHVAFKSFYMITGLPSHVENGTNPAITIENVVFDGNARKNFQNFGWKVNGTIGLHGGKTSQIRHNKFIDIPNENIVGHGMEVHHNTFANLNGSAFHTSVHDTTKNLNAKASFHDNVVVNPNRIDPKLNGHSEGAVTFSWGAGNLEVYNNTFSSDSRNYGVFGIFAGEKQNTDENLLIRNNRATGFEYIIKIYSPAAYPVNNVLITKNVFDDSGQILIFGGFRNPSIRAGCNYNGIGDEIPVGPTNSACL